MHFSPAGSVGTDIVIESQSSDSGFNAAQAAVAACVRFSGAPGPDPAVDIHDVACPSTVAATNVRILKVADQSQ